MVGITHKIMLAEIRRQQSLSKSIVEGQTAVSTGVTLNKASDNALAWVQVSDIARAQSQQAAWQANISYGTTRATNAEANLAEVANVEQMMPRDYISECGFDITAPCREYLLPLIQGEAPPPYENGIPVVARLKKIKVEKVLNSHFSV